VLFRGACVCATSDTSFEVSGAFVCVRERETAGCGASSSLACVCIWSCVITNKRGIITVGCSFIAGTVKLINVHYSTACFNITLVTCSAHAFVRCRLCCALATCQKNNESTAHHHSFITNACKNRQQPSESN
jgi:hypothetical protein